MVCKLKRALGAWIVGRVEKMGRANLDERSYVSLPGHHDKPNRLVVTRFVPWIAVLATIALLVFAGSELLQATRKDAVQKEEMPGLVSRGKPDGFSEKAAGIRASPYPWTNVELKWQRTGFHFQPEKNWMNDPDGPVYYKGWYHLFYQYNPDAAVWGNITWGHAVSKDLVHWQYLPIALAPSAWYDSNGVWTGSTTVLPGGQLVVLYTGSTNESVQVQNLAVPQDPSDPLLVKWVKSESNPVLVPPHGIGLKDFRDPTSAWLSGQDGFWRIAIGSKLGRTGMALVFRTKDFVEYEPQGVLHQVPGTGMWECVDFYPVSASGVRGLNASANGDGVKHVLKASMDDNKHDYYAIGTYDVAAQRFVPDDPEIDVGVGLRLDYGKYYASKTFFDPVQQRRILWGWVGETDSEQDDLLKGWASVQTIPRVVWFDSKTKTNLIQWPVEEINDLHTSNISLEDVLLQPGSLVEVNASSATQLDIELTFDFPEEAMNNVVEADVVYNCGTSGGSAGRGVLGPFGLLVLADKNLTEQTAVYFYIAKSVDGQLKTFFCHDETRSSLATDLIKRVYGSSVPVVLDEKTISVRVLVDHSIVESYAQGGRTCIVSRVYPTQAVYGAAHLFLFNNATTVPLTVRSLNVWQMNSVLMHPYEE